MERVRVSSSNVKDVGYDPVKQILEIGFLNGSVYQYANVPERKYMGLMRASSKGGYLNANVIKAGYRHKKIR